MKVITQYGEDLGMLEDGSFVGELRPVGFDVTGSGRIETHPGWVYANSYVGARAADKRLFDKIGTNYNQGGEAGTDFRFPDVQGRSILAWADGQVGAARVANAGGIGNAAAVGGIGGRDTVPVAPVNLPAHVHGKGNLSITNGGSHTHGYGTLAVYSANGTPGGTGGIRSNNGGGVTVNIPMNGSLSGATHVHNAADFAGLFEDGTAAGLGSGSPAHNNISPVVCVGGLVIRV